jgi:hypothetical protein
MIGVIELCLFNCDPRPLQASVASSGPKNSSGSATQAEALDERAITLDIGLGYVVE